MKTNEPVNSLMGSVAEGVERFGDGGQDHMAAVGVAGLATRALLLS